ncbi:hypothetical protein AJ80_01369 [Polytolypa hystricis UAMH7299]|uniref:Uncharacterized protein n=1 Tax=Polytolypa hystricis (strain UAMH7299) TaxID=1447883 RepID=A0A2B7Z064_POLH7|nr:hypothetical protein AJ80_01369 [Polytolypa hystricis UAMH7299]
MNQQANTLQGLFSSAKAQKKSLETSSEPINTPQFQDSLNDAISKFEQCQQRVAQLSLFSPNESVEDITTGNLQYLTLDYHLADILQRSYSADRLKSLQRIQAAYEKYMENLDHYGLLSQTDKKLYERYSNNPKEFSLAPLNDAASRREVKVTRFREEKDLKQKLEYLSQNRSALQNDDELARKLYFAEIGLYTHQTFQALDLLSQELSILSLMAAATPSRGPAVENDARRRREQDKSGYSERLDTGPGQRVRQGGPLLTKSGVPLQPFVLTNKRTELQKGVFRSGHNLPTMSIDEYLEEEKRRGGIIEGGGEASGQPPEIDEDDIEKADEETMKAREWDEFTEENPRGSGNTLNRG